MCEKENWLLREKGIQVVVSVSRGVRACRLEVSEDDFVCGIRLDSLWIGEKTGSGEDMTGPANDPYVIGRIEGPLTDLQEQRLVRAGINYLADKDHCLWAGYYTGINLRNPAASDSLLHICYTVPGAVAAKKPELKIFADGNLLYKKVLQEEGMFEAALDLAPVLKEMEIYLQNAHRCIRKLLFEMDRVCRKHGLRYYLICGSLLGAERNGRIIPWDDDADVAMPAEDYRKLLNVAKEEWGNDCESFRFVPYAEKKSGAFLDFMDRLVLLGDQPGHSVLDRLGEAAEEEIRGAACLDVYVLEDAFSSKILHRLQTWTICGLYGMGLGHRPDAGAGSHFEARGREGRIAGRLAALGKKIPIRFIYRCYEAVRAAAAGRRRKSGSCFQANGYVKCIPWRFEKAWFGAGDEYIFEGMKLRIPSDAAAYLHRQYPDPDHLPPLEMRRPAHWKEI